MNIPISYNWLKSHFEKEIPSPEEISRLFMLHLCEVEGMEKKGSDTIFDLKILPDRGHDLLAHRGIAREVSVLAGIPLRPLPSAPDVRGVTTPLRVTVEDSQRCPRYMGRVISGITVGESPTWLKERLESVGQRSINTIVDVTNFVMLELGQPMHAFDGSNIEKRDGAYEIAVRGAQEGETMTTLDGKNLVLTSDTLVIADSARVLALAGIKGGKAAEVGSSADTIILESANFNAVTTRRTSARVGIRTDSSKRFEHELSPALAEQAMDLASALILELCPRAELGEVVDVCAQSPKQYKVGISLSELNGILGSSFEKKEVEDLLMRIGFEYTVVPNPLQFVLAEAPKQAGKAYRLDASVLHDAPETFDCSSLVAYLWKEAGVSLPRMSVDQMVFGDPVEESDMKPSDLVFSNSEEGAIFYESQEWMPGTPVPEGIDHVGIYLGDDKIIHASRYNEHGVEIQTLSGNPIFKKIVGIRRVAHADEERFVITIPLERLDLRIKEDIAEEIGRVYGFHNIPPAPLPELSFIPSHLKAYYYAGKIRDALVTAGFSEVFTYSFQNTGAFAVENPIAEDKGFLRKDLATGIRDALVMNARHAPLLARDDIKIFEIGAVYPGVMEEKLSCAIGVELTKQGKKKTELTRAELENAQKIVSEVLGVSLDGVFTENTFEFEFGALLANLPEIPPQEKGFVSADTRYTKISAYPFVLRDIALWVPEHVSSDDIVTLIREEGSELLKVVRLFDVFTKEFPEGKKTSYAFNLVFQSHEKTLSDDEVNAIMERVTHRLTAKEYTVR